MGGTTGRARKPNCECRGHPEPPGAGSRRAQPFLTPPSKSSGWLHPLPFSFRRGWFPFSYTRVLDNDGSERVHTR